MKNQKKKKTIIIVFSRSNEYTIIAFAANALSYSYILAFSVGRVSKMYGFLRAVKVGK